MQTSKIAIIVKYFPTISETFIVNQINSLIEVGHDVQIYSYNKTEIEVMHDGLLKYRLTEKVIYFLKPSNSKFERLINAIKWMIKNFKNIRWRLLFKTLNIFKYGKEAYTLKLFYESQWFLIKSKLDIIHAHFGQNANRISYLKFKGILPASVKLVSTFHGYDLLPNKEGYYLNIYKHVFNESDAITVNTVYLRSILNGIIDDLSLVHILPVGLDTTFFTPKLRKKNKGIFRIIFCGRLVEFKAPDLALRVLKVLHELGYNKIYLDIIGEGIMFSRLIKQVSTLKLDNFVSFHGSLTQNEIKEKFEMADVFLLPGRYNSDSGRAETQGLVIQEAQSMKLPVIVSDVGGMKYGLIDGVTGFVVEENDIDSMSTKILDIMFDEELRIQMGEQGRKHVQENYDNAVLVKKLLTIYRLPQRF